jgi:hypothetical protein
LLRSTTRSNLPAHEILSLGSNLKVHEEAVNLLLGCAVINIDRVIPERDGQDVGNWELFFAEELAWADTKKGRGHMVPVSCRLLCDTSEKSAQEAGLFARRVGFCTIQSRMCS